MIMSLKQRKIKFKQRLKLNHNRDVTKISSCRVNKATRWGIKQLGFLLVLFFFSFPMKVGRGHIHSSPGENPGPRLSMTALHNICINPRCRKVASHVSAHTVYVMLRLHHEWTKRRHGSHNGSHPPSQQIMLIDMTNSGNNDSPCMYQVLVRNRDN